jgi:hypothetical protein
MDAQELMCRKALLVLLGALRIKKTLQNKHLRVKVVMRACSMNDAAEIVKEVGI